MKVLPQVVFPLKTSDMKLLCIDTALASCSVCVYDAGTKTILAAEQQLMERGHAEVLPPMVARVMQKAGIGFDALGRIAVTTGPGTFTGIRIGVSFARGLGLARNIKVIGINTMKAAQVAVPKTYNDVKVVHQAGASGFFYFFDENISTNIELLNPEAIINRLPPTSVALIGTGAATIKQYSERSSLLLLPQYDLPLAQNFAAYAASLPDPAHMPEPIYLREADAKPQKEALRAIADLTIRPAQSTTDLSILAKLHNACFDKGWSAADFASLLQSPGSTALLAQSSDGPIGFLLYLAASDEAEIIAIGVDPALRRRRCGQALLNHAISVLKSFNISAIFLEVATSNAEAIALYRNSGFGDAGLRKAYYARANAVAEDALVMRLNLN